MEIQYTPDDQLLTPEEFLILVQQVWPGQYDLPSTTQALKRTINITARENGQLVGCVRILTDGRYFGTVTEILVLSHYQRRGIGSRLMELVKQTTPTTLYFGAQPGKEEFYLKNGFTPGLPSFTYRPAPKTGPASSS